MSALQRIFEPIRIGRVTIPNRVVRTAHGTSMSHPGIERFRWLDVSVYPSQDPDLLFATARSEATLRNGRHYTNEYCLMLRLRDGRLSEYREYFNPLPAIAAFS